MTDEIVETIEQKLARYETVIGLQMQEIDRLRNVVAKMTEGTDDAHSTLRRLYLDESQPSLARIRAAAASLNFEKPRLESAPAPMDLVAEPPEPLADLVHRQRMRMNKMLAEDPQFLAVSKHPVIEPEPNGNADDDSGD
jgi:hypothetical protein